MKDQELASMREKLDELRAHLDRTRNLRDQYVNAIVFKHSGHAERIKNDVNYALACLESDNAELRKLVLIIFERYWPDDSRLLDKCKLLASRDPVSGIRLLALTHLARCFSGTRDPALLRLAACAIKDNADHESALWVAHRSFRIIAGIPIDPGITAGELHNYVRWELIEKYLDDGCEKKSEGEGEKGGPEKEA